MIEKLLIGGIKLYQFFLSPLFPACCRFTPTCSEYTVEAVHIYGPWKGVFLGVRRLMRCHPFHPGGYDPVRQETKPEV